MEKIIKVKIENGYYLFKLGKLLQERNISINKHKNINKNMQIKLGKLLQEKDISINKLMRDTNTDFKVLKRLISGDLIRIDIFVIARLCDYLKCNIEDMLEYFPNAK